MTTLVQSGRRKRAFLDAFREHGNVTAACRETRTPRSTVYSWQERDETFLFAYRQAEVEATELMEAEAHRRAMRGVVEETPILHRGAIVATTTVTKYSDTLLIFLLKARAPEKYRDRYDMRHSGPGGGAIPHRHDHRHTLDLAALTDQELEALTTLSLRLQDGTHDRDPDPDRDPDGTSSASSTSSTALR